MIFTEINIAIMHISRCSGRPNKKIRLSYILYYNKIKLPLQPLNKR